MGAAESGFELRRKWAAYVLGTRYFAFAHTVTERQVSICPMKAKLISLYFCASVSQSFAAVDQKSEPEKAVQKSTETTVPELEASLKTSRAEMAVMRERYTYKHPKMVAQLGKVADLERQIAERKANDGAVK